MHKGPFFQLLWFLFSWTKDTFLVTWAHATWLITKWKGKVLESWYVYAQIGPRLRELWSWQSKFSKIFNADIISGLVDSWIVMCNSAMVILIIDCQGQNSINFGLIFKNFVPKHISFSTPFLFIFWSTMWHVPMWLEKWNSQKLKNLKFMMSTTVLPRMVLYSLKQHLLHICPN